jgi:ribosomal protein L18E
MRHVKALRKEDETSKRLVKRLRSLARDACAQLKKDVPASYQKQSIAHPYLPFYPRIESCLNDMASYDPDEEDDVILSASRESEARDHCG